MGGTILFADGLKVASVKGSKLCYNMNPLINYVLISCEVDLFINGDIVEDPELLEFKYEFQCLYESINSDKIANVRCIMKLLESFNILMRKKLEYALGREDLKCGGCSVENCRSIKLFGSTINVHHDKYGYILKDIISYKIVKHICAPYPPRVKSARNF